MVKTQYITYKNSKQLEKRHNLGCSIELNGKLIVHKTATIDVKDSLTFGNNVLIRDNVRICGRKIIAGDNFYLDHHAEIGGGSCYCKKSYFKCGNNFHLGSYGHVNTARGVTIGNTVGLGRFTTIYTHGAYLDVTMGFPEQWGSVKIGNNVWMPHGVIVLPNVTIGDNTVIAAMSLVNKNIFGGGLWAGIPAKQVKGEKYPNPMSKKEKEEYIKEICYDIESDEENEMRRHGIRGR